MSWERVTPMVGGKPPLRATVAYRMAKKQDPRLVVALSAGLVRELGWSSKDRLSFDVNRATGQMRLARGDRTDKGLFSLTGRIGAHIAPQIEGGPERPYKATEVAHQVVGGTLVVAMPPWLRSTAWGATVAPPSVSQAPPVLPAPAAPPKPPVPRTAPRTAALRVTPAVQAGRPADAEAQIPEPLGPFADVDSLLDQGYSAFDVARRTNEPLKRVEARMDFLRKRRNAAHGVASR